MRLGLGPTTETEETSSHVEVDRLVAEALLEVAAYLGKQKHVTSVKFENTMAAAAEVVSAYLHAAPPRTDALNYAYCIDMSDGGLTKVPVAEVQKLVSTGVLKRFGNEIVADADFLRFILLDPTTKSVGYLSLQPVLLTSAQAAST